MSNYDQWIFSFYSPAGQLLGKVACTADTNYNNPGPTGCAGYGANTYFGGRLVSRTQQAPGTWVQTPYNSYAPALTESGTVTDRLGTVRAWQTGATWSQTSYYLYGEERTPVSPDGVEKFATYVRDSTPSAQDYAQQRYYSNITGRFFSPDPSGVRAADPKNPLSWNRYAYVSGDPVNHQDRTGLYEATAGDCIDDPEACEEGDWGDCDSMFAFMEVSSCSGGDDTGGGAAATPAPPLTCGFVGADFGTGQWSDVVTPTGQQYGFVVPVSLTFAASGGSGSYVWAPLQIVSHAGQINYVGGSSYQYPAGSSIDPIMLIQEDVTATGFTLTDAPGLPNVPPISSANVTWKFTTSVSVYDGNDLVNCGTINWTETITWTTNGGQPAVTGVAGFFYGPAAPHSVPSHSVHPI
jgi:RHS repeat-associated protein